MTLLVREPVRDGRHQAGAGGADEHVVADAVELDEDGAGRSAAPAVGTAAPSAAVGEPGETAPVGVVVADGERRGGRGGDGGHHRRDDDRGLRVGGASPVRYEPQGDQEQ